MPFMVAAAQVRVARAGRGERPEHGAREAGGWGGRVGVGAGGARSERSLRKTGVAQRRQSGSTSAACSTLRSPSICGSVHVCRWRLRAQVHERSPTFWRGALLAQHAHGRIECVWYVVCLQ
jgi:hypothetical protein